MKKEIWLPIAGFEGLYEVSNWGRVKSLARICKCRDSWRTVPEKILTPTPDRDGYLRVGLSKNGKGTTVRVHHLVWDTFAGTDRTGLEVNHIDEDKNNCTVWNLNLLTSKENNNWGTRNERAKKALTNHPAMSKAVIAKDPITLKVIYEFPSTMEAGRNGFDQSHICACCNGKQKTHKGLIWQWV